MKKMNIIYQQLVKLINQEEYFSKCEKSYFQCLEKNQFPVDLTSTINYTSVSIILKHFVSYDYYEIDTEIHIVGIDNKIIGYYRYIEDCEGNFVDDYLVGDFDPQE